ncbi:MAG: RidA family protein [Thermodesulfobacteriota bacterium]
MKEEVRTQRAPEAIGPYSQAVSIGRYVFLSGQIPIDPATGEVETGPVGDQARRVLRNLQAVVEEAGATMNDVVKTTVYLTDLMLFADVNEVYTEFFSKPYPARATVEVSGLPKGADVEIDAIVVIGDGV